MFHATMMMTTTKQMMMMPRRTTIDVHVHVAALLLPILLRERITHGIVKTIRWSLLGNELVVYDNTTIVGGCVGERMTSSLTIPPN